LPESKPEAKFKDRKVIKILRRLRQSRIKTLSKLSYTYERSLNKLLDQTTLLPSFTLREIISLTDPAFIKRLLSLIRETDKRIQEIEITESEIRLEELVGLEDLIYRTDDLRIVDVNPLVIKNFSGYSDYHSLILKVIITITGKGKLIDIRATLDTGAEVSYISLDVVLRFEILITHNTGIALRTIIRIKSRFVGFADNVTVTIRNTVVKTRFYIIKSPGIKVVLGFLFIQKARVIFRYLKDEEDGPVFTLLCDPKTRVITSVKTNTETEKARESYLYKAQNQSGIIESDSEDGYTSDSENA